MKKLSTVFNVSAILLIILVAFGIIAPHLLEEVTANIQAFISSAFGWYYLIIVTIFLLVCFYLFITPVGRIKLGKQEDKPDFSRATWIAMLFSAGMGIGLVFYGSAEPISHFAISSPTGEEGTKQGIKDALRFTFFHWGFHAWAIYGIVALILAYYIFRKNEPVTISSTLRPIFGSKVNGKIGKVIDIIGVLSTVFGVATTLGFGAAQINGGLSYLFDIPSNFLVQLIIIVIVTVLFIFSALSGLGKGIKILSNTNMGLAFLLLAIMFIVGPSLLILNLFTDTIGNYLQDLLRMSFRLSPLDEENRTWINTWTIFYWAWWIAWSPFVGIFIARVSKGRTIREFILCVLLLPSIIGFFWFATFGGSAIALESEGVAKISELPLEQSLFGVFANYPLGTLLSILAIILVMTFFITSADSGTYVLAMMSTNGSPNPSNQMKVLWGILLTAIALVLLYSGGLMALQNAMIIAALPFSVIIILMTISLLKSLNKEMKEINRHFHPKRK
ncbi:BCCT family transporter [Caldibacillus lycopersici]|uniref:BCCT family transporter n=1 Tax=Perspicuibacillus lycopersici TaxID=1325689 RepID=A0AAE3IU36_9BACI|nr:BCCT family transporter [Perspicuibacillus lycopersici]MCU9614437.1 BCCT family transporter [Perspicuibacillus lycopersici]